MPSPLLFCAFPRGQEEEEGSFGTLNSTLWWDRTQEDRVVF